jgi:DNA phosphorothioation-dependent restriction protein DptG
MNKMLIVIATILLIATNAHSQSNDSIAESGCRFKPTQLILPVVLIGTGVSGLTSDWMDYQNHEIKDELRENIDKKITIDDFSQYAPMVSVYALDLLNVKGEHGYRDYTTILATSYLLMGITVNALKLTIKEQRPDGSSKKKCRFHREYCMNNWYKTKRRTLLFTQHPAPINGCKRVRQAHGLHNRMKNTYLLLTASASFSISLTAAFN